MNTRMDIFFVMNTLSSYMVDTRHDHAVNHVLRCLKGMIYYRIKYTTYHRIILQDYVDLDRDSSVIDRKINLGCFFSLGYGIISWFSRKHTSVTLSTIERRVH